MKVVLVSQEYPPHTGHGGIATQTRAKAVGLRSLGHEVRVITHSVDGRRHDDAGDGIRVVQLPGPDARLPVRTDVVRWLVWSTDVAAELARLEAKGEVDIVDFPEFGAEAYVHLLNRTEWASVPTVVQLHGPLVMLAEQLGWPEQGSALHRIGTEMERTVVTLADRVYSSSACSADWCAARYGVDRDAIVTLHMGVDTDHFRPSARRPERPTIVFVGRLARSKGVDVLVDAACAVAEALPRLRLRLVGRDDGLASTLEARATAAGFPDLLEITGQADHAALPDLLNDGHVFAAPSLYEGGPGLVYLEAMACGLPVVAPSGSGITEIVDDGKNGLLVPPADVRALAAALRALLDDEARRREMGQAARRAVEQHDVTAAARRLEALYTEVADGAG